MPGQVPSKYEDSYTNLFAGCIVNPKKYAFIDAIVNKMVANKSRYQSVGDPLNIPWYVIAIIHNMEASLNFNTHLHNGDPLTARTVQVPKGRPTTGTPPFTWEFSATDSLTYEKLNTWGNWGIAGILYKLELYNGMGYYSKGINSPYLWSFSNQYTKGKYTSDGKYDPNAVSSQCGAAVLLRRMRELQLITLPDGNSIDQINALGETTPYNPSIATDDAEELQVLLNSVGAVLRVDGKAGQLTSNEYQKISGKYLNGDPRRT